MAQEALTNNPLGLNLDFLFGRGYLWAKNERLSDWIELDHLRMEIPDLAFPFDAGGGLHRFRNTRCLVREIEISTSEVGLSDLVRVAAQDIHGFDAIDIHFLDGAIHVGARVKSLGAESFLSFRVALIPPEPSRADEVHVSVYDYRAFGTLPFPARTMVSELLTRILSTPSLRPPGRGDSFSIGIAGDILRVRPLKLLLLHLFPGVGWKLPNLSNVVLEHAQVRPGRLTLRANSPDTREIGRSAAPITPLVASAEGGRALAAYEAKELFAHGDQAIFDQQHKQALELFFGYRDIYGDHPELIARLFDLLLSDPSTSNVAQAEAMCRELEKKDPLDLQAAFARPRLAIIQGNRSEAIATLERLAKLLRERGDTHDWILAQLSLAQALRADKPTEAASALREILRISPRNRVALEMLREIYLAESDAAGLEDTLKRLTGVYTDREALTATYLQLARHLMDREGELAESRIYLERVLRLDPTQLEALHTLGESYLLSQEPLRALKAFGSAARAAESRQDVQRAAQLHEMAARIWYSHVQDPQQALLSARRALSFSAHLSALQQATLLLWVAELCQTHERADEAIAHNVSAIELLERERGHEELLIGAHRNLARLFEARHRSDAAASHHRRILELQPSDPDAFLALESHYRMSGAPEQLLDLYRVLESHTQDPVLLATYKLKEAEVFRLLGMTEDAATSLTKSIQLGNFGAVEALVDLLNQAHLFKALREILRKLLPQMGDDRDKRWSILVHLGRTCVKLREADRAVVHFMEAVQVRPTQLEALYAARDALETIVSSDYNAPSPIGDGPASRLLERVVSRLAEVAPEPQLQREALIRQAELATLRGDMDQARASSARASAIPLSTDVDNRLDELLSESPLIVAGPPNHLGDFRREMEQTLKKPLGIPPLQSLTASKLVPKLDETTHPEVVDDLLDLVRQARSSQDPEELVEALQVLIASSKTGKTLLDAAEMVSYSKELGELLYYDLEDSSRALPHLEFVRETEPQGRGAEPGILNALESIYEEKGEVLGRIKILENRLARAESEEMDTVYRLLIAQLVWDSGQDREGAIRWLQPILERDQRHEAAHRLMADMARDLEDWEATAEHLRTVLAVSSGGLDSVETERELAELLLQKLSRPRQAIQHLRHVLQAAPGDSGALNMLKESQVNLGDWRGYTESLTLELGLLTGRKELTIELVGEIDPDSLPTPLRIPASQIVSDLAHVAEQYLDAPENARQLWKLVHHLWPEHVEALERRIDLDRSLEHYHDLATDLEAYADLLLDPRERFRCLLESARIHAQHADIEVARVLFTQAIAIAEDAESSPEGLDEARRELQTLST